MTLKISGAALSLQWAASIKQAEYCLTGTYQALPSLVEHPGEVIKEALAAIIPPGGSRLGILQLGTQADLGSYSAQLSSHFRQVSELGARSGNLSTALLDAASALEEQFDHLVISETTPFGAAAVVLSREDAQVQGLALLKDLPSSGLPGLKYGYIGIGSHPDEQLANQLALILGKENPITPGTFNAPRLGKESLPVLIQTMLSLTNKIIPAWYQGQEIPPPLENSPSFLIRAESRPWLVSGPEDPRRALLALRPQSTEQWRFSVLEEVAQPEGPIRIRPIPGRDPLLFPISGQHGEEIFSKLDDLSTRLSRPGSFKAIAYDAYAKYKAEGGRFTCCLLGKDRDQLDKEIQHAGPGIQKALADNRPWTSPAGSYFAPQPLGGEGEIAFVYPGAFNSYPGMARELFFSFPELQDAAGKLIPDLSHSLAEDYVFLGGPEHLDQDAENQLMADFYQQPNQLIESGISLSVLYTLLLDQVFDIQPAAAFGYSLGEISMLWAAQVWQNARDSSDSWKHSPLFKDRLFGEMRTVREFWGLEGPPQDFWSSYILKAEPDLVREVCREEPRAFLTILNTPQEVVIAGETSACQRVISQLGCKALPMPFNAAIHNPAIAASYQDFVDLYDNPTTPREGIRFYSAADYQALAITRSQLANSMAKMTTSPIDFPRLVNRVYQDGVRIFLEVGPQKTCSRWIERILEGKPHAVIPLNKKYQPDLQGVFKVISLLVSHGVAVDLNRLYPASRSSRNGKHFRPRSASQVEPVTPNAAPAGISPESWDGRLQEQYFQHLDRISAGMAASHQTYLTQQGKIADTLGKVLSQHARSPGSQGFSPGTRNAIFSRDQIQAFTIGDPGICFGEMFSGFEGRRIPRLPNGPLQFLDRVVAIDASQGVVSPGARLTSEFDLAEQNWFSGRPGFLPIVALLEIALQPCGFLSAYLGSILGRERQDLYFRNLDGEGTLHCWPTNPGKTITNRVELISSSSLGDVIIQKYSFELAWGGETFFSGVSSFGYFTLPMLRQQSGLEDGGALAPWYVQHGQEGSWRVTDAQGSPVQTGAHPHLPRVQRLWFAPQKGAGGKGYLYVEQDIPQDAWFYGAHFHQDPVMPGSLGIENMARALMAAASRLEIPGAHNWRISPERELRWKYRGQITPDIKGIALDLSVQSIKQNSAGWEICADGRLWNPTRAIYQVTNLSLESFSNPQE